ncbi:GGDEF domain-containing protein [Photobacterium sagamiensis]|uniref:GGDEF domain-containing protein n=1 Tax=Photobacterium sagamiensis TaxID=2910241 RepID=UPI003D0D7371
MGKVCDFFSSRWFVHDELEKKVIRGGFAWSIFTVLGFYLIIGFYLNIFQVSLTDIGSIHYGLGLASLAIGLLAYRLQKPEDVCIKWWVLSSIFICFSWVILGLTTFLAWGGIDEAEKIWIIGFMVMLMGWHINSLMLVINLLIMISSYVALAYVTREVTGYTTFMIILSGAKFLLLFAVFQASIGRLYKLAKHQYKARYDAVNKDELTGVLNRRGFNDGLRAAISLAERKNIKLSLLAMDVDYFKQYNDSLGHPAGDACLVKLAGTVLRECSRETDIVARVGGEEFAIILTGCNENKALMVANRIQNAIKAAAIPHPQSAVSDFVTVSIGITEYSGNDPERLYHNADRALYKAKYLGRNIIHVCHCEQCE